MQEQQNVSTIKINNTEIDYAKYVDVVMPMNNLIEYSDNCSKIYRSLFHYCRHEPNPTFKNSESFQPKVTIKGKTSADGDTKDVKIAEPLKHFSSS